MVKKYIFAVVFIIFTVNIFGFVWVYDQILNSEKDIEKLYEQNFIDYETYLNLMELFQNKIDINRDSLEELLRIPHMDEELAKKIISKRRNNLFQSREDLLEIDIMDKYRYKRIKPFLKVSLKDRFNNKIYLYHYNDKSLLKNKLKYKNFRSYFSMSYNSQINYYREGNYYFFDNKNRKAHLSSFYLSYQIKNLNFVMGDYRLKLGEGLMISNGSYYGRNEIRDNLTRTNYLKGIGFNYNFKDISMYGFYSGYEKEKSCYIYNNNTGMFEKETLQNIYWQETRGISIQYKTDSYYLGLGAMHYFDKFPENHHSGYYSNIYYNLDINEFLEIFGEGVYSNSNYGMINKIVAEYDNFYFNISYFRKDKELFLPFFYKSKRDKKNIFILKIKNKYDKIRFYSKFKSETKEYEANLKYYGKINYDFNKFLDGYLKYYNNDGNSYYSSIGVDIERKNIEIENELKRYSNSRINLEVQFGYSYDFLNLELDVDYKGDPDERWKKRITTSVTADPIDNMYMSFYYYRIYSESRDDYFKFYLRTEI